jgi:hypothetical protein
MRWRTYNRLAERFEAYDDMTYPDDSTLCALVAELMRRSRQKESRNLLANAVLAAAKSREPGAPFLGGFRKESPGGRPGAQSRDEI